MREAQRLLHMVLLLEGSTCSAANKAHHLDAANLNVAECGPADSYE